ncbi:MAG: transcriptional regulator [Phycisphaerales bacterium]|nr:transcriptional regulator [Phycisphaerales bacterium]
MLNAFLDMTAGALTRAELLTWLILYRDIKPDGTTRTSQEDIAGRAGITSRAVRFALRRLVAFGLVRIVWQGGFRKGASVYAVRPLPRQQVKGETHDR